MRADIQLNERAAAISEQLVAQFEKIYDEELGLDIYNLGFLYGIQLDEAGHCEVTMTFSEMGCGCLTDMPKDIEAALIKIPVIKTVNVEVVWEPSWTLTRISRMGRIALGISVAHRTA